MSTEDFMLCESQTSIDLDGFETIDVRSIDLQETNTEQDVEHVIVVKVNVELVKTVMKLQQKTLKKKPFSKNLKVKKPASLTGS